MANDTPESLRGEWATPSPQPAESQSPSERFKADMLTVADRGWLAQLMDRQLPDEELPPTLAILNGAIVRGSDALQHKGPEEMALGKEQRYTFFEVLGWMDPDHVMYEPFEKLIKGGTGFMIPPATVVRTARSLEEPAGDSLLNVFRTVSARVLRLGQATVAKHLEKAEERASLTGKSIREVIAESPTGFIEGFRRRQPPRKYLPATIPDVEVLDERHFSWPATEVLDTAALNVPEDGCWIAIAKDDATSATRQVWLDAVSELALVGSVDLRSVRASNSGKRILDYRAAFFHALGWDDPSHRYHAGFQRVVQDMRGYLPNPLSFIANVRKLQPILGDELTADLMARDLGTFMLAPPTLNSKLEAIFESEAAPAIVLRRNAGFLRMYSLAEIIPAANRLAVPRPSTPRPRKPSLPRASAVSTKPTAELLEPESAAKVPVVSEVDTARQVMEERYLRAQESYKATNHVRKGLINDLAASIGHSGVDLVMICPGIVGCDEVIFAGLRKLIRESEQPVRPRDVAFFIRGYSQRKANGKG